jgi:hypothetical protein
MADAANAPPDAHADDFLDAAVPPVDGPLSLVPGDDCQLALLPSLSAPGEASSSAPTRRFCHKTLTSLAERRNRSSSRYPQWRCFACHNAYNRLHSAATTESEKNALNSLKHNPELFAVEASPH